MAKSETCGHASISRGGKGSTENLAMGGGGLLHPQDSILSTLGVSYTSEGLTSSMRDSIMQCSLLRYRGLCHLTGPVIPPKLTPETLPKSRVPEIFRKVPLSPVRWGGYERGLGRVICDWHSSMHEGPGASSAGNFREGARSRAPTPEKAVSPSVCLLVGTATGCMVFSIST